MGVGENVGVPAQCRARQRRSCWSKLDATRTRLAFAPPHLSYFGRPRHCHASSSTATFRHPRRAGCVSKNGNLFKLRRLELATRPLVGLPTPNTNTNTSTGQVLDSKRSVNER